MAKKILIIHGPNLNLLGKREPEIYGSETLIEINNRLIDEGKNINIEVDIFQNNSEGMIIDRIQLAATEKTEMIIINPAALTHTSVALRDALLAVAIPFIEVHLSNVFSREPFRHHSYLSDIAVAVISGLGSFGYTSALHYANLFLTKK